MKTINFTKMTASGNDFVIIDNTKLPAVRNPQVFAKKICDRQYGVGADGLLILEKSKIADFRMRIINADGTEAEMCGNGARCAALYAKENSISADQMRIDTLAGNIEAKVLGDKIRLKMSEPKDFDLDFAITIEGKNYRTSFVNTGVPHAVIFVEHLDSWDVRRLGKTIRFHKRFAPTGANVDFVEVKKTNFIKVRTYERGVENETLACGTGVVASAIISSISKRLKSPITCLTKGGKKLKVYFKRTGRDFQDLFLEGDAKVVFKGEYFLE
ncbi:MAG: diaminopimelate epimerase [Candidatus Omnitrophota bacterium]